MRKQNGFTIIEIAIALAIAAVVIAMVTGVFTDVYKAKARADFLVTLSTLRLTFQRAVIRTVDWDQTKMNNSSMSCFSGSTPATCTAQIGPSHPVKLMATNGTVFDGTLPNSGYTLGGSPCTTYPTNDCVLRPLLTWKVQCDPTVDPLCERPVILIKLDYLYSGPDLGPVNFPASGFSISQPTFPLAALEACTGLVPTCSATQAAICSGGSAWTCQEFGL